MAGLKDLKQRKKSIQSTLKVTSEMKMIAASKLKRSQDNMIKARPYSSRIKQVMQMLVYGSDSFTSEFFEGRDSDRTLYVLLSSDRGLCGGFNNNITKSFMAMFRKDSGDQVIGVGNKICSYLENHGVSQDMLYKNAFSNVNFVLASKIGNHIISKYKDNEIDKVYLIYNRFESALSQVIVSEQIMPVELAPITKNPTIQLPKHIIAEPSVPELFDMIFPRYINFLVWRGLLESFASENAARMTTMDSATENAQEMIESLSLEINKARQSAITQEITEIVGGSSAISE